MKKKVRKSEVMTCFHVITLGDCFVGKTSIIRTLADENFNSGTFSTIGINFNIKEFTMDDDHTIGLKVIDTCGQEKFRSLSKSYFKNVDAVLFVFSLNDNESFDNIKKWIELYDTNSSTLIALKYLVGNKNDLEEIIDQKLIEEFSNQNKLPFISISAKDNNSIQHLFEEIAQKLYKIYKNSHAENGRQKRSRISLNQQKKKKNLCCAINLA